MKIAIDSIIVTVLYVCAGMEHGCTRSNGMYHKYYLTSLRDLQCKGFCLLNVYMSACIRHTYILSQNDYLSL